MLLFFSFFGISHVQTQSNTVCYFLILICSVLSRDPSLEFWGNVKEYHTTPFYFLAICQLVQYIGILQYITDRCVNRAGLLI